jgi:sucrose-6-phosphate hydrolase SacC (GH32 family)
MKIIILCVLVMSGIVAGTVSGGKHTASDNSARRGKVAAKPLFRDPVYDGAADPVIVWNRRERKWLMFYTNRRAKAVGLSGVAWVHGTRIGIAESTDGGATWKYRGTAEIGYGKEDYTHWAPDIVYHGGLYHMFLTIVPGTFTDWNATREIVHLTSSDLLKWKFESALKFASDKVIDPSVIRLADGTWRMWYNNERDHKYIYYADSADLYHWQDRGKAVGERGEGPKVFRWKNRYWMLIDVWRGLVIYSSDDGLKWTRQPRSILEQPGKGTDDQVKGGHADVLVSDDRAFLFYFTHPGRQNPDSKEDGYEQRRSSIQVVELEFKDGEITCDRDAPTHILLKPPRDKKG